MQIFMLIKAAIMFKSLMSIVRSFRCQNSASWANNTKKLHACERRFWTKKSVKQFNTTVKHLNELFFSITANIDTFVLKTIAIFFILLSKYSVLF